LRVTSRGLGDVYKRQGSQSLIETLRLDSVLLALLARLLDSITQLLTP
jgi:hypothetical protein